MAAFRILLLAVAGLALSAPPGGVHAQPSDQPAQWSVDGDFDKDTRKDLSGVACAPTNPPMAICIVANDEMSFVERFKSGVQTVEPEEEKITLPGSGGEIDAEGAAFDPSGGYFYVAGSHGRSRKHDEAGLASYAIYRFRIDAQTQEAGDVETGQSLHDWMKGAKEASESGSLASFFDEDVSDEEHDLSANGANVEGLAAKDDRIWLGFRAPVVSRDGADHAFVVSVATEAIFGDRDLDPKVVEVQLGEGMGVRDLAAISDGFLILSGPARDELGPAGIFWWDGSSNKPRELLRIEQLDMPNGAKAEAALVLDETDDQYRVLILFDGEKNGKPREYSVTR